MTNTSTTNLIIQCLSKVFLFSTLKKTQLQKEKKTSTSLDKLEKKYLSCSNDRALATFKKINNYIQSEKAYLKHGSHLKDIANTFGISTGYLSQIINKHAGQCFSDYINAFRIAEAKNMLLDSAYQNYTIDAIAFEAGFKSKSNFYTVFKKLTLQTPKQYQSTLIGSQSLTS